MIRRENLDSLPNVFRISTISLIKKRKAPAENSFVHAEPVSGIFPAATQFMITMAPI